MESNSALRLIKVLDKLKGANANTPIAKVIKEIFNDDEESRIGVHIGQIFTLSNTVHKQVLALPDFDPENLRADPIENRLFKPMRSVYEMGSIFKIFNTALAFENGIDKEYYVKEPFKIPDKSGRTAAKISDIRSFKPPRPNLTVEEIMVHSCNVGSAQIALDLPDDAQKEFFERLHMDGPLDLEFGRTERTLLPKKWGPVERATVAFGHGISVTPMHLLLAMNAVTNGGIYIYPTLQKRSVGVVHGERVLADEISAKLRPIMLRVAEETSGKKARVAGIQIGGKTATRPIPSLFTIKTAEQSLKIQTLRREYPMLSGIR